MPLGSEGSALHLYPFHIEVPPGVVSGVVRGQKLRYVRNDLTKRVLFVLLSLVFCFAFVSFQANDFNYQIGWDVWVQGYPYR